MKICVAQTRPIKGDIQDNIDRHKKLVDLALSYGADMIIFPELSLTGYEPKLAKVLATHQEDHRLDDFQKISDTGQITIGVGIPTKNNVGVCISMMLFQPHQARRTYSKRYLHRDEEAYFVSGQNFPSLEIKNTTIAPAICYELSIPDHAEQAFRSGADVYVASVAKSASGVEQAGKRLSNIARKYSMAVLMSNCLGPSDDFEGAGRSAMWDNKGLLVSQLDDTNEGIMVFDTDTQERIEKTI